MTAGRRVTLLSIEPKLTGGDYSPFSFGVRRIQASLLSDPALGDVEVSLCESPVTDVDYWMEEIERTNPDVVGVSAYVWSFPTFVELTRRMKRARRDRTIVFGGPSARPAMFALPLFADAVADVDALVPGDGEAPFRAIVGLNARSPRDLRSVPGVSVPGLGGFGPAAPSLPTDLDALASPLQMGLVPGERTVALETYRGCPLSCSFCQWGDMDSPTSVFSSDYLVRELSTLQARNAPSAQLVDAALNLNSRAFKNLTVAEESVGYFKKGKLFASVYPSHLNEQHLDFLAAIKRPRIDVGVQSLSKQALDAVERPFSEARFAQVIEELSRIAELEVEIILGIPGDTPEAFRATLTRVRELPCRVRVFHCLVLPDALMTRAPAENEIRFDPLTLKLTSCVGWSEEALAAERANIERLVAAEGGEVSDDMWQFTEPERRVATGPRSGGDGARAERLVDSATLRALAVGVDEGSGGAWRLARAVVASGDLLATVETGAGEFVLEMRDATRAGRAYRVFEGVAFSYRPPKADRDPGVPGFTFSAPALRILERVAWNLRGAAQESVRGA